MPSARYTGPAICRGQRIAGLHAIGFHNLALSAVGECKDGPPGKMTVRSSTHRKREFRGSEDGATAVEAALVLSLVVSVVLIIIDFAQAFFIWNTLQLVVGQTSRNMIVQNGNPVGSVCDATCAEAALQRAILDWLGQSASICTTPTAGQYCVNATCNPASCSSTAGTTATMKLSAMYGFDFLGAYTLAGQITVPIGLWP